MKGFIIGIACAATAFSVYDYMTAQPGIIKPLLNTLAQSSKTATATESIQVGKIKELSELVTGSLPIQTVVSASADEPQLGFFSIPGVTTQKMLYIAHGEVVAGIDLSQLTEESITAGDIPTIKLPAPKIFDAHIDVKPSKVWDYKQGVMASNQAVELQAKAQAQALDEIVKTACESKVLEAANKRAELVIGRLFQLNGQTVKVETTEPTECSYGG